MHQFSANKAYFQLSQAHPRVAKTNEVAIRALLERVTNKVINDYLKSRPKSTVVYLGEIAGHGISLSLDRVGRVNTNWVDIPNVRRAYAKNNHLWDTINA